MVERVVERAVERAVERVERVEKKIGDRCSGYGGGGPWIWRGRSVEEMAAAMAMTMGDDGRSDGGAAG